MRLINFCAAMAMTAGLAGCDGDPSARVAEAEPAVGERLVEYSRTISERRSLSDSPDLIQRFCKNAFESKCPADIRERLEEFGLTWGGTGIDLADTFVVWIADEQDGNPDMNSSDEVYLRAAYRVALGREPDEGGARANLDFIKEGGGRKLMLRSLLESPEFRSLQ